MSYDDELLSEFVVEANEHLADVENQFLTIEASGEDVDVDLVNEVFRAIHSIKGAAGFLGMTKVNDLAHSLENILNMMRNSELTPNSAMIDVMLRSADRLQGLINDIQNSNEADVSEFVNALEQIAAGEQPEAPGSDEASATSTPASPEPSADEVTDEDLEAALEAARNANPKPEQPEKAETDAESVATEPTPGPAEKAPEQIICPRAGRRCA